MKSVIQEILKQQSRIAEILGFYDRPECNDPIDYPKLEVLVAQLQKSGWILPPSYIEFLSVCNGCSDFSCSFSLLGYTELMNKEYATKLNKTLESGVGFEYGEEPRPLLIGTSKDSNTKVFYEFSHEREVPKEPIVIEGEPGLITIHDSFYEFLNCRLKANDKTITYLLENSPHKQ